MEKAAKELDFMQAAKYRDEIKIYKKNFDVYKLKMSENALIF